MGQHPAYLKVGVARSKHLFGPYTKSDTPVVQTDWERWQKIRIAKSNDPMVGKIRWAWNSMLNVDVSKKNVQLCVIIKSQVQCWGKLHIWRSLSDTSHSIPIKHSHIFCSIIIFIDIDNIFMQFISHPAKKFPVSDLAMYSVSLICALRRVWHYFRYMDTAFTFCGRIWALGP